MTYYIYGKNIAYRGKYSSISILKPEKISYKIKGKINMFSYKQNQDIPH